MIPDDRYGRLDRFLHRVAFRAGHAQRALADVEDLLYRGQIDEVRLDAPVFITALPRSGTTILLELLHASGHFASHTYRDMPFVLCPVLWNRFSRRFATDVRSTERFHGDGLRISADSPEAFEEMIWKEFWPDHYRSDRIRPWASGEENAEFESFLEAHMRKVIFLRRDDPSDERRYVSKNNLNIARMAARPGPLRRGVFLVPFREPVQQAASMLRQHRRFMELHEQDDFLRRYMEAIGHHEFGRGLRPVNFGGWLRRAGSPEQLEFWIRYWRSAYRFVLDHAGDSTVVLSYAALTERPESVLAELAGAVGIPEDDFVRLAGRLRPPRSHDVDPGRVDGSVLEEASALHRRLQAVAVG